MTKKSVIWLSVILGLIVLIGVLFGTVFCLRTQTVKVVENGAILYSKEEIIDAAQLKNGQSIFLIDKETAIKNIENKYANIKVVQIKTVGLTEIQFVVRARHKMFYVDFEDKYIMLDEDLKVLEIISKAEEGEPSNEPTGLIKIVNTDLNITNSINVCDFVGSQLQQNIVYNLYNSMINTFQKTIIVDGEDEKVYFSREDVLATLNEIEIKEYETFNKLIIKTEYGVTLDVEAPSTDLKDKINICYYTIEAFITAGEGKETKGTIKIYKDSNGIQKCIYLEN